MPEIKQSGPIKTIAKRCRKCYACVRTCPTKAIGIRKDCAVVLNDRCIGCGKCLQVCSQGAKVIADAIEETQKHLRQSLPTIAVLGCSYPAFFYDTEPGQMAAALRKLGFIDVLEGAAGVELIAPKYRHLLGSSDNQTLISSHCPTIVDLIELHYPQLLKNLVPVVSPMIAIGRYIKSCHKEPVRVVYISSCIGGKFEVKASEVAGAIDTVLTYKELKLMLENNRIDPRRLEPEAFNGNNTLNGRSFSIAGGPFHIFGIGHDGLDPQFISTVGEEASIELIRDIAAQRIAPRYVDVRFCKGGCIGGPGRTNRLTAFSKRNLIIDYRQRQIPYQASEKYTGGSGCLHLGRGFSDRQVALKRPGDDALARILHESEKFTHSDELNCGSCGYRTCREHAVAVYQGLAEIGMCHPFSQKRLEEDRSRLERKYDLARRALDQSYGNGAIIGDDLRTQEILKLIQQVGPTPTSVLIRGESGTGKELTARAIHQASLCAENPLVTVNCTALSDSLLESELFGHKKGSFTGAHSDKKGLFEAADGGTIFLDEIGDITPKVQAELLRVLDSGEIKPVGSHKSIRVNVRIIAATNKSLEEGIDKGWFREDLFYRINVFSIHLPPLRERLEALPKLVENFLNQAALRLNKTIHRIDESAQNALACYHWPGNIRELQNVIERAAVLSPDQVIHLEQLPVIFAEKLRIADGKKAATIGQNLRMQCDRQRELVERNLLQHYLEQTAGNVTAAARLADIPRRTFYRMLERHNLDPGTMRQC
ncbi:MAG: AAA domain-containing protein [Deltaproteobacteria bacterium]|nr:AAA domain-containing protein [Deltaproteobacteria bacterium]